MDGTDRLHRFRTCANSPSWRLARLREDDGLGSGRRFHRQLRAAATRCAIDRVRNGIRALRPRPCSRTPRTTRLGPLPRSRPRRNYGEDKIVILTRIGDPGSPPATGCGVVYFRWAWESATGRREGGQGQPVVSGGRRIVALAPSIPAHVKDRSGLSPPDGRFHPLADCSHEVEFSTAFVSAGSGACQEWTDRHRFKWPRRVARKTAR